MLRWLRCAGGRECSNGVRLLQEWKQWAESCPGGWPVESDKLAMVTQKYGQIEEIIGIGSHGAVLMSHKTGGTCKPQPNRCYALKIFSQGQEPMQYDHRRRVIAKFPIGYFLHHPHIIKTFDLLPVGYGNLCACMEYCSGGDLHSLIVASRQLLPEESDCFFKQLVCGVLYLHKMHIAHRDLKPENLLLTDRGCLKISDFGNAECFRIPREDRVHMSSRRRGSAPYISPEQYLEEPFDPRKTDIWAAAIVYIAMRAGRNPWNSATDRDECFRDYLEERRVGKYNFLIREISHEHSCELLHSMLSIDAAHRPGASELLSSQWLQEIRCCQAARSG
ncbi:kinase-like protein [Aspergillus vadensis CBS 113365]|uniref:non-specific serine/threonine protein kinase n=1 Tax=Aspergillus vadensis (strain CBS 113365 / IMI 142717 / IBT 24658) TaxID=1448311 RepID=A0A319AWF0_ASPVC|nr:kinase-like protein [Aspergillus vadensis CBS 113365]PYH63691.1 kinase-like protein [Aspergillus vadensis CBS 113365]